MGRDERGRFAAPEAGITDLGAALLRFRSMCRFEPETGCVVWTGGKSAGRGHHVSYGVFWFAGRRWFAHRWSAKFIHRQKIEGFDVDHRCPCLSHPNTLCVEHVRAETPARNRELQTMRKFVYLQVGLLRYDDVYGPLLDALDDVPFYHPPSWLGIEGPRHAHDDICPF